MPIEVIFIFCFLVTAFTLIWALCDESWIRLVPGGLILLALATWVIYASYLPYKVESEQIVSIFAVDKAQCISYNDRHGKLVVLNVNEKLGRQFAEGEKIKIMTNRLWYYAGISYPEEARSIKGYEFLILEGATK